MIIVVQNYANHPGWVLI